jgi:hypothetical protein
MKADLDVSVCRESEDDSSRAGRSISVAEDTCQRRLRKGMEAQIEADHRDYARLLRVPAIASFERPGKP